VGVFDRGKVNLRSKVVLALSVKALIAIVFVAKFTRCAVLQLAASCPTMHLFFH
jgi:hypothetical protein